MRKRNLLFTKNKFGLGLFAALAASSLTLHAQNYTPVTVTGFSADVIANGAGPASGSTSIDMDGSGYNLVAQNFVSPNNQTPTAFLPANGIINSAATPGLSYQLAPYTGNNTLRITGTGSGTLTFATPASANKIYLLGTSVFTSTFTATVNFTDGSTQLFTNLTMERWMATNIGTIVTQGIGKIIRATSVLDNPAPAPTLYQILLTPSAINANKLIQSITFNKTSSGSGEILHILGISIQASAPSVAIDAGVTAISAPNSGCALSLSNQETVTVTVSNLGTTAQSNIPVSYKINNGTPVNEVLAGPVAPQTSVNYSFNTKANLSATGVYTIEARTNLTGDLQAANDASTHVVTHYATPASPTVTTPGTTTICSGSTVTLTASSSTTGATYQWHLNGNPITGATSATYVANAGGSFTATAIVGGSCASAPSAATTLTVNTTPPAPGINYTSSLAICSGDSVALTASSSISGATFTWFKNGNIIPGATGATYHANSAGSYTATANNNGCVSPASVARTVTVKQTPTTPSITQNGNLLVSSSISGNQWFKDGVAVSGATVQSFNASSNGVYTVKVTANGCTSAASNAVSITNTGVKDEMEPMAVQVYPNPSSGLFNIELPQGKSYELSVTDLTGKLIQQQQFNSGKALLDLQKAAKGIYILQITSEGRTAFRKLTLE